MHEIRPATVFDAAVVAAGIRPGDKQELAAMGYQPLVAVLMSMQDSSRSWAGVVDGEVICVFGVGTWPDGTGRPWMIGTALLDKHAKLFLSHCRECVSAMRGGYALLHNHVDVRNERAIRWIKWLGFEIGPAVPVGMNGEPFYRFWMWT